ncbi:MAG: replicative DNA helicase, partial [Magnetococcales bacterium]|nr:replicative DNA helicase [Magnetococcales bacterium]
PTGFTDLDRLLSGLQKSDLLILAGRPAMGKTTLVMNMAANAAMDHNAPVAVFSLEMSKEQLATRLLASTARVDAQGLRTGRVRDEDYNKLVHAAQSLSQAPIYIDDSPALSILSLRAKARRLKREKGIQLLVVDYLQLMQADGDQENRVQEISQISRGLKGIAKELDIPVLALSQLSRKVEERPNKKPILSDLRESGSIEQDADIVLFVHREEVYKENDPSLAGLAEVIVAKQRNGPTGTIRLSFQKQYTRFENHASPEYVAGHGG